MERRLTAILAADVAGYSRLMEQDEEATLAALKASREIFEERISRHRGRIFGGAGDSLIAEFASPLEALRCALAAQEKIAARNAALPEDRRMLFRIGLNIGDVLAEDGNLFGEGVNIAARIEALAEPGGVYVSGALFEQVNDGSGLAFDDLGARQLKNIAKPLRVYRARRGTQQAGTNSGTSLSLPNRPSIAVLPFHNISGDPEQEYFSDGISEDIITELSRFRSLFVIARSSVFSFKDRAIKAEDIGRELGVEYLVEGSVRKAGDKVRVGVQLSRAANGENLWAERYDRELADIFSVQDEITQAIAATIGGRLGAEDRRRASLLRHSHPTAYDFFLRAQALYYQITRVANAEAVPLLEKAIEIDPDYARAHILLAAIHNMDYMEGWSHTPRESRDLALRHAQRALVLDEADSLVQAQLGEVLVSHRRLSEAMAHFENALALNPNDVEARALYGANLGDEAGLQQVLAAERLDPCNFVWMPWIKGSVLYDLRRYDEAVASLSKIDAQITSARGLLAASLAQAGRIDEARDTLRDFLEAAREELAHFPEHPAQWQSFWQREGQFRNEDEARHLFDGLRMAGLDI